MSAHPICAKCLQPFPSIVSSILLRPPSIVALSKKPFLATEYVVQVPNGRESHNIDGRLADLEDSRFIQILKDSTMPLLQCGRVRTCKCVLLLPSLTVA